MRVRGKEDFLHEVVRACETIGLSSFPPHDIDTITAVLVAHGHTPSSTRGWPVVVGR